MVLLGFEIHTYKFYLIFANRSWLYKRCHSLAQWVTTTFRLRKLCWKQQHEAL